MLLSDEYDAKMIDAFKSSAETFADAIERDNDSLLPSNRIDWDILKARIDQKLAEYFDVWIGIHLPRSQHLPTPQHLPKPHHLPTPQHLPTSQQYRLSETSLESVEDVEAFVTQIVEVHNNRELPGCTNVFCMQIYGKNLSPEEMSAWAGAEAVASALYPFFNKSSRASIRTAYANAIATALRL